MYFRPPTAPAPGVRKERSERGTADRSWCTSCSPSSRVRHGDTAAYGRIRTMDTPVGSGTSQPPRGSPTRPRRRRFPPHAQADPGPTPPSRERLSPARRSGAVSMSGSRDRRSPPTPGRAPAPRLGPDRSTRRARRGSDRVALTSSSTRVEAEPERASLGVPADAPQRSRMDDLSTEIANPLQRRVHVGNREVRERHPIAGARSTRVEAQGGTFRMGLPAFAFTLGTSLELHVQEPAPESASPGRIVGGELHESERQGHPTTIPARPMLGERDTVGASRIRVRHPRREVVHEEAIGHPVRDAIGRGGR
jgi:hypothetical protein